MAWQRRRHRLQFPCGFQREPCAAVNSWNGRWVFKGRLFGVHCTSNRHGTSGLKLRANHQGFDDVNAVREELHELREQVEEWKAPWAFHRRAGRVVMRE